ncbi:MAG: hypothetical protein H6809_05515 [Phycisphaeraceae bacterium]|nr:hypothetical protein [Phycisphaeraceae bacterium]
MVEVTATDEWRIIVPLRFNRANHGQLPNIDCPEVDDRGYIKGNRPNPWGDTTVRGPSFGVLAGDAVRVRVVRDDIDGDVPLAATSSDPAVLTVRNANGLIAPDGELWVEGQASGTAAIDIHLGDARGPVLGQADVRVHSRLRVALTPHLVRIDSTTTNGVVPAMPIDQMIRRLRAIWRPCGIDFNVRATVNDTTRLPSNRVNFMDLESANWLTDVRGILGLQRSRLGLAAGTRDQSINWYIIQEFVPGADGSTTVGLGVSRRTADDWGVNDTGIIVAARANGAARDHEFSSRTLAHEVGHFFRLEHVQRRNADRPVRDTYGRRQLMYPLSSLSGGTGGVALPRFDNVGYGDGVRGCLLTMKNHNHHSTDGECATARNAIHSNNWF